MELVTNPTMLRIQKDGKDVFTGYKGILIYSEDMREWQQEEVKGFAVVPEIRHKGWKKLGLEKPLLPEQLPQYSFADLMMTLYYTIKI